MDAIDRGQFLRLGAAGLAAAAAGGLSAAPASAALPPPAPVGDDLSWLQLGYVGELVSTALYAAAAKAPGWTRSERRWIDLLERADRGHLERLRAALGAEAPGDGDFAVELPAAVSRSRRAALQLAGRIEAALTGVYLSGSYQAQDPATRLLLARLAAADAQHQATLRVLRGVPATSGKLPGPALLEQAATVVDRYVTVPDAPPVP